MWPVNLLNDVICAVLNALGGYHWLWCRRFVMPVVMGVSASIVSHVWWLGFLCLPACGTLCLGYPSGDNWGRALWLFIQAVGLSSAIMLFHHLNLLIYIPYIVGAGILGGLYKNWNQILGDAITGFYLSLFIWFVHG